MRGLFVGPRLHGHDRPGKTQLILISDGDDPSFFFEKLHEGHLTRGDFFASSAALTGIPHCGDLHSQTIVPSGIVRWSLISPPSLQEQRDPLTLFAPFLHGHVKRLKACRKAGCCIVNNT